MEIECPTLSSSSMCLSHPQVTIGGVWLGRVGQSGRASTAAPGFHSGQVIPLSILA